MQLHESDEENNFEDEDMAMMARKFRKFFKKNNERRIFKNFRNQNEKNDTIICYEWKKPCHIIIECHLLNKLKKKAMVATWDNSDEETSENEE